MIDVKELRVGVHVSIGGVRHCVSNIDFLNRQMGIGVYVTDCDGIKHPIAYSIEDAEPIPLTAELLQEIRFERYVEYGNVYWRKEFGNGMYVNVKIDADYCVARIKTHFALYDIFRFKYLHELEAFVYLTTKQELIKEG